KRDRVTARVYQLYQERLAQNNGLDFDDLIMKTVELFEQAPEVLERYQRRFRHVLVDEYQDINYAQYKFVTMLAGAHRNIAVVGDDDQSIYGWRGANVGIILDFEKDYPDARVIKLEQNYRSTQKILECAYDIIKQNESRADKRLWTENPPGDNIVCYEAVNEQEEATYIADTIRQIAQEAGRKWSDFAVLYRTNAQSRVIEEAFLATGLPYRIVGGLRFYERKEIKDLLAYLRVLHNPRDGVSLRRIIGAPPRGIGDRTMAALDRVAYEHDVPLFEAMQRAEDCQELGTAQQQAVKTFVETMVSLMERVEKLTITELTNAVLDESEYLPELLGQGTAEAASRVENLQEFLSVTQQFQNSETPEEPTLEAFLEHISLLTDIDQLDDQGNAVVLMTLHAAKGLEFPIVFIAGLEEELLPHRRSMDDQRELEEERRLCYVGITRAQELLYLTRAYRRTIFGQTQTSPPSRFLAELPAEFVDRHEEITQLKLSAPPPVEGERAVGGPKLDLVKILSRQADRDGDKAKRRAEAAKAVAEVLPAAPEFKAGNKVKHPKFGEGIVVTQKGTGPEAIVTVAFKEGGVKKLQLEYARLERV
ncbi:MAG: 3'-5' exonuclease, partial [Armatimonadota bacterium]